jgi:NTE family protein
MAWHDSTEWYAYAVGIGGNVTRVGLVLGAGGVVGQAYHAGVLAALEHDLGWDPRTADLIVGSSAGSITGTLLRLGVPASDLAAFAVDSPLSTEGQPVLDRMEREIEFPAFGVRDVVRPWRLPKAALVARVARSPLRIRPSVAALTLAPAGRVDLLEHVSVIADVVGDSWPERLWLSAVRRDDGRRVMFGRPHAPAAPLPHAVAASCAIPAYFRPVRIGRHQYFDGGVHSPTNADVVRREGLDLVVVVSPMSSRRRARTVDGALRWRAHRQLMREAEELRRRGTTVVRFEPGRASLAVMGVNAMANDRSDRVVQEAFLEAGALAGRPDITRKLGPLISRSYRRRHLRIA